MSQNNTEKIKLDYSLTTCEERAALVQKITDTAPKSQLTERYLEILSDYILDALPKEEKDGLLTKNRLVTINKRETSFEGLAEKFENGEDGLYNIMIDDKNVLLSPKMSISEEDVAEIPELAKLREGIERVKEAEKKASGYQKFLLKKQLIDMYKDQYVIRDAFKPTMQVKATPTRPAPIDLSENRWIGEDGLPHSDGLVSFFNPDHISAILCNYSGLKIETAGKYQDDFFYLMEDFDKLLEKALYNYPMYKDIVKAKIDNISNQDIQKMIWDKYKTKHTVEYISALWRHKIPELIAEQAENDYLIWYYQNEAPEKAKWKRCSICGQLKLAHNRFFSKNSTSRDGLYSICKACRNAKARKNK